jgi:Gram-negative porin
MRVLLPAPTQITHWRQKMNWASMNAISRITIAAAAGLVWSVSSAAAADLGGNCCADLEERIAELEATTARKGNRKMSLTISGQVTRSILYWNDGGDSATYAGLDNHAQSTRFVFSGTAKVRPDLTAGFEFMTEIGFGGRTSGANQLSPDGNTTTTQWSGDSLLAVRTANWWLEDKTLGRVTVGRINLGGPVATIDLGGISTVAHFSPGLVGGSFLYRDTAGALSAASMASLIGPTYGGDRIEGIRYDSPSLHGFLFQASWGEDEVWSASLRYAGEFSGFRFAAGIGYQHADFGQLDGGYATQPGAPNPGLSYTSQATLNARAENEWSGSLALMHTASGLFAQGHIAHSEFYSGGDAGIWLVQGGITKNWFGLGNTSVYGEYGKSHDFNSAAAAINTSDVKFFGLGAVQQIDAAAMELYLGWRRFDADTSTVAIGVQELDIVHGGARVRF